LNISRNHLSYQSLKGRHWRISYLEPAVQTGPEQLQMRCE
jgi:hypothetical protein